MRKNVLILLVLLCGLVSTSFAQYTKQDFAYGIQLRLAEKGSVYVLSLPATIYQHVYYPDMSDIRVFNAAGQMVPSVLYSASANKTILRKNVPFFMIANKQGTNRQPPQLNRQELKPDNITASTGEYFFDTKGYFPVQTIKFTLPQTNMAASVTIFSRNDPKVAWELLGTYSIYNLQAEKRQNLTVKIRPNANRYWKIVADPASGLGTDVKVGFGWAPRLLVFVAQGQGPFTVAYGSARVDVSDDSASSVMQDLRENHMVQEAIKIAYSTNEQVLAGDSAYQPRKAAPVVYSSKQYILWGILAIGVILLLLMAWSLYKQLYKKH